MAFSRKRSSASTFATRPYSARRLAMANMLLVQMMKGSRVTPKTCARAITPSHGWPHNRYSAHHNVAIFKQRAKSFTML